MYTKRVVIFSYLVTFVLWQFRSLDWLSYISKKCTISANMNCQGPCTVAADVEDELWQLVVSTRPHNIQHVHAVWLTDVSHHDCTIAQRQESRSLWRWRNARQQDWHVDRWHDSWRCTRSDGRRLNSLGHLRCRNMSNPQCPGSVAHDGCTS